MICKVLHKLNISFIGIAADQKAKQANSDVAFGLCLTYLIKVYFYVVLFVGTFILK